MADLKSKLIDLISLHEGVKYRVYDDANGKEIKAGDTLVGHPTIGVGRNVASDGLGLSIEEINFILVNDINRVTGEAKNWVFFNGLSEVRQAVIIDMLFNMGRTRFNPNKWPNFFGAIKELEIKVGICTIIQETPLTQCQKDYYLIFKPQKNQDQHQEVV